MNLFETDIKAEQLLLVGVSVSDEEAAKQSLLELAQLSETAGAIVKGMIIQNREQIHPGTYVGKGKIEEIAEFIADNNIDTVVCDDELSPAQLRNLNDLLEIKVIDRTIMILDIFAMWARTSEGKIQVELAQLQYRATRLVGLGGSLSRLGGGIGTRGPGEKKLEMDRRLIRERIGILKRELDTIKKNRETTRRKRACSGVPLACIVGYTNAGKSTLLNTLTDAGILSEDKLFATLDPTTRAYEYEDGQQILLTDTVGFISKLPHHLVEAFRSTLEEAKYADIIIHAVDISNPRAFLQMDVVYETLDMLGVSGKPVITVYNKIDLCEDEEIMCGRDERSIATIRISAKTGQGIDLLLAKLQEIVNNGMKHIKKTIPYSDAGKISVIRAKGRLLCEEYREDGVYIEAMVPQELNI